MASKMNSEKPWIFSKIALYFAFVSPFVTSFVSYFVNNLHFWLLTSRYGKEILIDTDATKRIAFNFDIIPIILSLSIILLCFLLRKSNEDKKTAGIAFVVTIFMISVFSVSCSDRFKPRQAACLSNIKQIGLAIKIYEDDYDSHLPPLNSNWNIIFEDYKYILSIKYLDCPNVKSSKDPSYAFNKNLAELNENRIIKQRDTIAIFESKPGKNLFGTSELLPKYPRHNGGENYGFLDGHAKWLEREGLDISKFQPIIKTEKSK